MVPIGKYRVDFYDKDGKLITQSRSDIASLGAALEVGNELIDKITGNPSFEILRCVMRSDEAG